jgi:hypothetical protein
MWLSPVIQATGRQEQWDGLRWKISTSAADGIWWPHYDHPIGDMVLDKAAVPHEETSLVQV